MAIMRKALFLVLWSYLVVMAHYELTAKSTAWSRPLPGWDQARLVERDIAYRSVTRIPVLDRFLHENQEARLYYLRLLG